ncbi:helix-turn-helix domain-containing protein [Micromonospora taraxaci]|uniref:helix-turn-helix domain-containing protein n=1 Tax=Micromonospora taraxaci TaxID=1316803 RepID=UPI0033DABA78
MDELMTVKQAAVKLKVNPQTVYRMIWSKEIAWVDVGRGSRARIRITEAAVAQFVGGRLQPARPVSLR